MPVPPSSGLLNTPAPLAVEEAEAGMQEMSEKYREGGNELYIGAGGREPQHSMWDPMVVHDDLGRLKAAQSPHADERRIPGAGPYEIPTRRVHAPSVCPVLAAGGTAARVQDFRGPSVRQPAPRPIESF